MSQVPTDIITKLLLPSPRCLRAVHPRRAGNHRCMRWKSRASGV